MRNVRSYEATKDSTEKALMSVDSATAQGNLKYHAGRRNRVDEYSSV